MKRKNPVKKFLSEKGREMIEKAVRKAESKTSGEIVVRVVGRSAHPLRLLWARMFGSAFPKASLAAVVERKATADFMRLGIQQTRDRTGVLVYISLREKMVVVRADRSIDEHVGSETWQQVVDAIVEHIAAGKPAKGICKAVDMLGKVLRRHFPRKSDDTNELPDLIVDS